MPFTRLGFLLIAAVVAALPPIATAVAGQQVRGCAEGCVVPKQGDTMTMQ
jgi:hypothetical protein